MAQQGSVQKSAGQSNWRTAVFAPQIPAGTENEVKGNVEILRWESENIYAFLKVYLHAWDCRLEGTWNTKHDEAVNRLLLLRLPAHTESLFSQNFLMGLTLACV